MLIEIRQAVRALRHGVGPLSVSVLSLSLGIAATAIMVSVIDAIDLRPLPFREAAALLDLSERDTTQPDGFGRVAPGVFHDWRERTRSLSALAAASSISASLEDGDAGVDAARVTGEFFAVLGAQPALGRLFGAEEVRAQARVAVIADDVWRARFGGDPRVIGRTVSLSWAGEFRSVAAEPYTIIGVLPRAVRFPLGTQVWIPAPDGFGDSRRDPFLTVLGRPAPGMSLAAVRAELESVGAQLKADFPEDYARRAAVVTPLREAMRAAVTERGAAARIPLLGVAAFVLVLAVFNVAGLFLARTAQLARDLRTRVALGASRGRLAVLLLTQSLTMSGAAGAAGVAIAWWALPFVSARLQVAESGMTLVLDGRFLLVALLLSLVCALLVAAVPVWSLRRIEARGILDALSARGAGRVRTGVTQQGLVIGQVALAVVLLSGASGLAAEFLRLSQLETGFDPDRLIVATLPISTKGDPPDAIAQARLVEQQIAALGGLTGAAIGGQPAEGYAYRLERGHALKGGGVPMAYRVSPDYFATLRIPVRAGRAFDAGDREGAAPVGIVNRLAANLWWPQQDPIGKSVYMARRKQPGEWVRIVGLVENERVRRSMTAEVRPVLYRPFDQLTQERRQVQLLARAEHRPEAAFVAIGRAIEQAYGGGSRGERVTTMERMLGGTLAEQRFRMSALSLFSLVALLLAAMGIYGVVATMVARRTAEFGVRLALGARPAQLFGLVFRQAVILAVAGFALGLAGTAAMTRIFRSLIEASMAVDARIPLIAGLILAGTVFSACYFPARRAARIDPSRLLHDV